jgi:intein/homing endonuclease
MLKFNPFSEFGITDYKQFKEFPFLESESIKQLKNTTSGRIRDNFRFPEKMVLLGEPGIGKCLKEGTKVFTEDGWEEINNIKNPKLILSLNTQTLKYEWDKCYPIKLKHNGICNNLLLEDGKEITCTPEHPLLVMNKEGKLEWRKSEDIKVGDYLTTSETVFIHLNVKPISNSFARILGFLISDGHLQKRCNNLQFHNTNETVIKQYSKDFLDEFGVNVKRLTYRGHKRGFKTHISFTKKDIFDKINKFIPRGNKSGIVKIPSIIFNGSLENQSEFVKALYSCDGTIDKQGYIEYYSKSKRLVQDLNLILINFGCRGRIFKKQAKLNGKDYGTHYRLRISDSISIINFFNYLGFFNPNKNKRLLEEYIKRTGRSQWSTFIVPNIGLLLKDLKKPRKCRCMSEHYDGKKRLTKKRLKEVVRFQNHQGYLRDIAESPLLWSKVVEIKQEDLDYVYDVTTEKNHSFIAEGIVSHNSTSLFYIHDLLVESKKCNVFIFSRFFTDGEEFRIETGESLAEVTKIPTYILVDFPDTINAANFKKFLDYLWKLMTHENYKNINLIFALNISHFNRSFNLSEILGKFYKFRLDRMTEEESKQLIKARLKMANCDNYFEDEVYEVIYKFSKGIPRNIICASRALVDRYINEDSINFSQAKTVLKEEYIDKIINDREQDPQKKMLYKAIIKIIIEDFKGCASNQSELTDVLTEKLQIGKNKGMNLLSDLYKFGLLEFSKGGTNNNQKIISVK